MFHKLANLIKNAQISDIVLHFVVTQLSEIKHGNSSNEYR